MNQYYFFKADELMVEIPRKVYEDWDILVKPEEPYIKEIFIEGKPKNISINHDKKKISRQLNYLFIFVMAIYSLVILERVSSIDL